MIEFVRALLSLALDAAPWLVIGFVIGGLFKSLLPVSFLQRHLRGDGLWPVLKAAVLGMPLPLCSCGVIPAAMGLRAAGASKSATTSFLVATPETGVDSISISYALLGPVFTLVRPIAALYSAILAGGLVAIFGRDRASTPSLEIKPVDPTPAWVAAGTDCCGNPQTSATPPARNAIALLLTRLRFLWSGVAYTFTQLYRDILKWLIVGLVFAAAVQVFLPEALLATWGQSDYALLFMAVVGIPMYVCATASTPIAAGLLVAGVSPGAVMVFLMAGPATNMATIGAIQQKLGRRVMVLYLFGVMVSAISVGWVVNQWLADMVIADHVHMRHDMLPFSVRLVSLLLLVGIALWLGWQRWSATTSQAATETESDPALTTTCCDGSET